MAYRGRLFFSLYLLLRSYGSFAQTSAHAGDSIKGLLSHAVTDSQRVYYLELLASWDQTIERNYPAAISDYRQLLALNESARAYRKTLANYSAILNLYFYTGDYPGAMETVTKGLALAESHSDSLQIARFYNTMGFIYFHQGNAAQSAKYYALYLQLCEKARDTVLMADAYNSIGELQASSRQFQASLSPLFKAYDLYQQLGDTERVVYTSYKISQSYKGMKDFRQALIYADRTLQYMDSRMYNEYDKSGYYINTGDIYKGLSDYPAAIDMTRKGLAIALSIRHREDVADAWQELYGIYAAQHRFDSAYVYFTRYSALKDSLSNEASRREIEEIHERFSADEKDKEIMLQKAQLARQNLIRNVLAFSSLFLIAFILLLYNRRRIKQRAELNQHKNLLFGAIIAAQDNERKRIAQDLHDTLGSILSATKMNLSSLEEGKTPLTEEQTHKYRTSLTLLDQVSVELRNIAHNIMPAGLSKIGLPAAVKGLVDTLSGAPELTINYSAYGFDQRLSESIEISLYRILLELINNVIKHAGATLLTIQMIRYPRYINIVVEDNGIGFDQKPVIGAGKGMGLNNIISRIAYLKGTIDIDSRSQVGTTILIEVPC